MATVQCRSNSKVWKLTSSQIHRNNFLQLWPVCIAEHSQMRSFFLCLLASRSTPPGYKHAVWHKRKLLVCGLSNLTTPSNVLLSCLFTLCNKITTDCTDVTWNMSPLIFLNNKTADSVAFNIQKGESCCVETLTVLLFCSLQDEILVKQHNMWCSLQHYLIIRRNYRDNAGTIRISHQRSFFVCVSHLWRTTSPDIHLSFSYLCCFFARLSLHSIF